MRDDGVDLVPLHHADIEEAGIFAVHHRVHHAPVAVAVILRRLHEADARSGEGRDKILKPVRMNHVIGVEHADDLGFRRRMVEREPECAGFEAPELVLAHKFEAWPKQLAVLLDRPPQVRFWRVIDDHDAFEIGPVELGHAIQRLQQHLRRLAVGRNMDRHEGAPVRNDVAGGQ